MFNQPLAHKFLAELFLGFSGLELLFVAVGIEIAADVGCVNIVDEDNIYVTLAKFIFGVHKDKPLLCRYLGASFKQGPGIAFHYFVVFA